MVETAQALQERPQMTKADQDRAALIEYIEEDGTFFERLWLPILRRLHKIMMKGHG